MKSLRFAFLSLALIALLAGPAAAAKPGWSTDYTQGLEQAKKGKKLILLDFTGSDWCGWCIKIDREIFSKPEFKAYAEKNLVLVELDFPRGRQIPATERAQNEQLATKYDVQGFPTIIVLDAEGREVGQLGYTPGGASAFIAELEKLRKG